MNRNSLFLVRREVYLPTGTFCVFIVANAVPPGRKLDVL
jgi:hypothetical protein